MGPLLKPVIAGIFMVERKESYYLLCYPLIWQEGNVARITLLPTLKQMLLNISYLPSIDPSTGTLHSLARKKIMKKSPHLKVSESSEPGSTSVIIFSEIGSGLQKSTISKKISVSRYLTDFWIHV